MRKELERLREEMRQAGCDAYITADCDDHLGEYTDRHFNCMEFVSGFTGGDGTLVVTMEEAGLWTDGRYFIQAEKELKGSGITLMKEGQPDCPEMLSWIREHIPERGILGFDGKTVSFRRAKELKRKLALKGIGLSADNDLIAKIWTEGRPAQREEKIWILPERYAGKSAGEKLAELKSPARSRAISSSSPTPTRTAKLRRRRSPIWRIPSRNIRIIISSAWSASPRKTKRATRPIASVSSAWI